MEVTLRLLSQGFCQSTVALLFCDPTRSGGQASVETGRCPLACLWKHTFLPLCNYCSTQTHAGVMAVSSKAFYTTRKSQLSEALLLNDEYPHERRLDKNQILLQRHSVQCSSVGLTQAVTEG